MWYPHVYQKSHIPLQHSLGKLMQFGSQLELGPELDQSYGVISGQLQCLGYRHCCKRLFGNFEYLSNWTFIFYRVTYLCILQHILLSPTRVSILLVMANNILVISFKYPRTLTQCVLTIHCTASANPLIISEFLLRTTA